MFPDPPLIGPRPPVLTGQQRTVLDLLTRLSTESDQFALWYLGSLETITRKGPDYLTLAAHSIRELTDRLPSQTGVPKFESPVSAVKSIGPRLKYLKTQKYQEGWSGKVIDGELNDLMAELERVFRIYDSPPRTARLKLALISKDPLREMLPQDLQRQRDQTFKKLGEFFQNVAHHNHTPTEPDFLERVATFERLLLHYLTPVSAEQQTEILDMIEQAPSQHSKARLKELLVHSGSNVAAGPISAIGLPSSKRSMKERRSVD